MLNRAAWWSSYKHTEYICSAKCSMCYAECLSCCCGWTGIWHCLSHLWGVGKFCYLVKSFFLWYKPHPQRYFFRPNPVLDINPWSSVCVCVSMSANINVHFSVRMWADTWTIMQTVLSWYLCEVALTAECGSFGSRNVSYWAVIWLLTCLLTVHVTYPVTAHCCF